MNPLPGEDRKRYVVYVQTENHDPSDEILLEDVYVFSSDNREVALGHAASLSREEGQPAMVFDTVRASRLTGTDMTLIALCEHGTTYDGTEKDDELDD